MSTARARIAPLVLLSLLSAIDVRAQETVETLSVQTLPAGAEAADAGEAVAPAPIELEKVTVTGELIAREASRTTSSVKVYSGKEIERSTASDIYDLIRATPNASLDDSDYGVGGMTIRGVGSYGAAGSGAYAAYATSSAVVLDGIGLPRSALAYADLSAFDLDSVEVLRGPQSTSQGRNAMAGAVILNTALPTPGDSYAPELRGRYATGSFYSGQTAAALGATLWPDRLAAGLVYDRRRDDGDIRNDTRDENDWARQRSSNLRLRLNWQPGGGEGRYQAVAGVYRIERFQGSRYVTLAQEENRVALSDTPQDYANESLLYALEQRLSLSPRWRLRAISAYVDSETRSRYDADYTAQPDLISNQQENARAFSQELRADFSGERLQTSFGAYYFRDETGDVTTGQIAINGLLDSFGLCGVQLVCSGPLGNVVYVAGNPSTVEDIALFGELDYALTRKLTLTAGARLDRERNSRHISSVYQGDTPVASAAVLLLDASGALPNNVDIRVARQFSEFLPKLAARYEVLPDWFLGASYTEGYRPGGDGYNQVSGRYFRFDSEKTANLELSLKGRYRPWRLETALNLYYTRWQDMQIQAGMGTDNYMENAALSTLRGGELELRWRPLRALRLIGGVGVTRGRFESYQGADNLDYTGNHLPKAVPHSVSLALEWMPAKNLLLRADGLWVGAAPANADNDPVYELPAYRLFNVALRWQPGPVGLFLTGSNLTDERYRKDANSYAASGEDVASLGERRRVLLGTEFRFR